MASLFGEVAQESEEFNLVNHSCQAWGNPTERSPYHATPSNRLERKRASAGQACRQSVENDETASIDLKRHAACMANSRIHFQSDRATH